MALQEAIEHAREVADRCSDSNKKCSNQHKALADWLEELKTLKEILGDTYDLDRLRVLYNQRVSVREEVAQRWRISKNIPIDRLRELVEADRDGRCVAYKFGIGSNVYRVWIDPRCNRPFISTETIETVKDMQNAEMWMNAYRTKEEAEQALKERDHS